MLFVSVKYLHIFSLSVLLNLSITTALPSLYAGLGLHEAKFAKMCKIFPFGERKCHLANTFGEFNSKLSTGILYIEFLELSMNNSKNGFKFHNRAMTYSIQCNAAKYMDLSSLSCKQLRTLILCCFYWQLLLKTGYISVVLNQGSMDPQGVCNESPGGTWECLENLW